MSRPRYRLHLLFARSLLQALRQIRDESGAARGVHAVKFYQAALLTGVVPRSRIVLSWFCFVDLLLDRSIMFFLLSVLTQRDRLLDAFTPLERDLDGLISRHWNGANRRVILTMMHTRLFYFDLLLLFAGLARRGITLHVILYENFVRSALCSAGLIVADADGRMHLGAECRSRYGIRGDVFLYFIDVNNALSLLPLLRSLRGSSAAGGKEGVFVASDIALGPAQARGDSDSFTFLNVRITPKRGIDYLQTVLACPVTCVSFRSSLCARRLASSTDFPAADTRSRTGRALYALYETAIRRRPLLWSNWATLVNLIVTARRSPPRKDRPFKTLSLQGRDGKPVQVAITRKGRLLVKERRETGRNEKQA
jgi:hypothetical protein